MRTITLNDDVIALELIDHLDFPSPLDRREWIRLSLQLDPQRVDMIAIDVRISKLDDEFACVGIGDMCDHMREERVGRDIEGYSEAKVGGTLEQEAREPRFLASFLGEVDIKLA